MTRRDLLKTSAAVLPAAGAAPAAEAEWYDRPMRWAQLAFVEDDPGNYDLGFWLDYFKRIRVDAATISAGGCVAFYPTKIPYHYRSKFMKDGDPFGELLAGCRKLGMNVVARIDPHAMHDDAAKAHPEWIALDSSGKPRRHWAMPDYWVTCGLGPYNFEFMTEVVREIVSNYKVDGIFANRWSGSGMCYCEQCQKNFRTFSGLDLPRTNEARDMARRQYTLWRDKRLFELWELWEAEIKKRNPRAAFIPNTGGGALAEIDMKRAGELAPTLFADRQARNGTVPPWANGKNGKEYRAALGNKAVVGLFSVGLEAPYRWKDSVQSPPEILIWAADGIAQGMRPWVIKFNAKPLDQRWFKPVEQLFTWHARNERYMRNTRNLAEVGLVYSQQTARFYAGEQARAKVEDHTMGAYHALVEARIPFEMMHDQLLEADRLKSLKVLVLPNIAALSESQCKQIEEFVASGGGLVATHESSLYNEWGTRRQDFGLSALFGCSFARRVIDRQQNAYINIEDRAHPLLKGLGDAGRFIHGVQRVEVTFQAGDRRPPLTTMPSYPDLPMEEVYLRVRSTDIPAVFCREHGKGRVVYFPWDIDRTFWEVLSPDHGRLLANAVLWAAREEQPLEVAGPGVVDVAYWEQKDSVAAHIVNLTNPMMMKGPFREILPVGPQKIRMRLPGGKKAKAVRFLAGGTAANFRQNAGWIEVTTPPIGLHEVVAVDLV